MSRTASWPRATPFSRPPLARLFGDLSSALRRFTARDRFDAAEALSERLLDDIGAPEWLRHRAAGRRESELQRLGELRLGLSSVDSWHW